MISSIKFKLFSSDIADHLFTSGKGNQPAFQEKALKACIYVNCKKLF
jgi:hypothetical protein